ILDIKMPCMNGLELAQLIKQRKRSQHVPILFLTAYSLDESEVLQAYGIGAVDFLSKPINPEILRSKVAVFASLFRTTRALASAVEALNAEVVNREAAQEQLRLAKERLETRVLERTVELARANREGELLAEALRESDRRKDEFLATLAHELRNPLAPIRYAVKVVGMKGPETPELRWAVDIIERQTQHMARLIDDLLDVNRITRNTLELRKETVDLASVISSAVEASHPLIEQNQQKLVVELPSQTILMDGDTVRLAQVFSNLLHNASKYSKVPEAGGTIWLTAVHDESTVSVSVRDNGI